MCACVQSIRPRQFKGTLKLFSKSRAVEVGEVKGLGYEARIAVVTFQTVLDTVDWSMCGHAPRESCMDPIS